MERLKGVHKKLECLSLASLSRLVYCLWVRRRCFEDSGHFSVLYYKPITIINDDSSITNYLETSLIDDARVIIYDCHMFIVQAPGLTNIKLGYNALHGTHTLAYYEQSYITYGKCFIT